VPEADGEWTLNGEKIACAPVALAAGTYEVVRKL
jgi:hypothetical protein